MKIADCQLGQLYSIQGVKWLWVVYKSSPDRFLVIRGYPSNLWISVYNSFFAGLEAQDFDVQNLSTLEKEQLARMGCSFALKTPAVPKGCTCEITTLMATGCTCGWIAMERKQ